jgi:hypothetical protein
MQTPSGATSDTSVTDLLEDHFDSLGDFATNPRNNLEESSAPPALPSPGSEHGAKENAPNNEKMHKVDWNNDCNCKITNSVTLHLVSFHTAY